MGVVPSGTLFQSWSLHVSHPLTAGMMTGDLVCQLETLSKTNQQ